MPISKREVARAARAAQRRRKIDPDKPPFSGFLDRDADRAKRNSRRNRTLVVSLAVHLLAVVALLAYSFLDVDELFGPSVEVKLFRPGKLPAGVVVQPASPAAADPTRRR
jgi:hypothetical protein